jgi:hypothetical protein
MAGQVSPGIVLRERDLTTQTIVNTQANTAALVGSFAKGPVGTITSVTTEKELYEYFGAPTNNNYEDWFSASTFLSYGGQLQVVRIEDAALKNAVTDAGSSSSNATKLYVVSSSSFAVNDLVKVGSEYFLVTAVTNTAGEKSLTVTRQQLGSAAGNYASGAAVTKWTKAESATVSAIIEQNASPELTAVETTISVDTIAGFTVNSYAVIKRSPSGGTTGVTSETVKIVSIDSESKVITVERGQLGSTAIAFDDDQDAGSGELGVPTLELRQLDFATATPAVSSALSAAYPVVTVTGIIAPLIKNKDNFESNYSSYTWKFAARTAGEWANNYQVAWVDGSTSSNAYSTLTITGVAGTTQWSTIAAKPNGASDLHIVVLDNSGNIVETFLYVSSLASSTDEQGSSNYYVNVINARSSYIYAGAAGLTGGNGILTLSAGSNAWTTNVANINNSYDLFADTEEIEIDFVLVGGSLSDKTDQISKAQKAVGLASSRKDCVAFVSPHKGFIALSSPSAQRDEIVSFFDAIASTSYAVLDSGYKYIYDRFNDVYRYVPCNADVAGLCVQTSSNLEDWFSPAGLSRGNLKNVVKLAYVPSKTDRDKLYLKRINPITSFPGSGVVLFGDKTALSTPSAFDRINVRRLFLTVEKRIASLAKSVLFELNDVTTRSSFAASAASYLAEVKAKRGVTDYLVVCDETNNTADVIDRNEFVAEIYLKPARSINYVTITFVATRSGVSFNEVTGR